MDYVSTRDLKKRKISASEAIATGLAPDGGLYVPCQFPILQNYMGKSYQRIAADILKLYLTDFSENEIEEYVELAYGKDMPVKINGQYLELFHGRTSAFKDVALQLYPYLLTASLAKNNIKKTAVVLVATSGDTGSAVIAGMADVPNTRAIVFYPDGGVSEVQKLQMTTQEGGNINVFGIKGNFDDAQSAVKELFEDTSFKAKFSEKYIFTSANSINLGRLLPQIAYYFYAYGQWAGSAAKIGEKVNFVVPTGNFGNILAGYYAKKMGLPIKKLICASNSNKVLYDFITTGTYNKNRELKLTISPSMDILVSSNLERLLYDIGGCEKVISAYESLKISGEFTNDTPIPMFESEYVTEGETIESIRQVYDSTKLIIDPHTAVAKNAFDKYTEKTGDETPIMILATASPHKFPAAIESALGKVLGKAPANIAKLGYKAVLHNDVVSDIKKAVGGVLS
jgi:threonine synthase